MENNRALAVCDDRVSKDLINEEQEKEDKKKKRTNKRVDDGWRIIKGFFFKF